MNKRVATYVGGVWVSALIALALLAHVLPTVSHDATLAAYWFSGLAVLGQVLTFQRRQKGIQGSVSSLPVLTALVLAPATETIALVTVAALVGELVRKKPLIKRVFNVGMSVAAVAAAVSVYVVLAGPVAFPFTTGNIARIVLAFAAASVTQSVVTAGLLAGVLKVSEGAPIARTVANIMGETIASDLLTAPFMYFFIRVYAALGWGGALVLTVPLFGMRQLFVANWQLRQFNEELLELMVAAIEARDPYTSGHSRRVAEYSRMIARGLGLSEKQVDEVAKAALLHDVGKMDEKYAPLLRKPGRLTEAEEAVMQTHSARSAELVSKVSSLKNLIGPVRHHHEAWDGTGYPDGLAGERIPLAARIVALADTIDAMSSERPYRAGLPMEIVRAEIVRCRGKQFDPTIADRVLSSDIWESIFPKPAESGAQERKQLSIIRSTQLTG